MSVDLKKVRWVRLTPDQQLAGGLLHHHTVKQYVDAARILSKPYIAEHDFLVDHEKAIQTHSPTMFLYCHAAELLLKAYLFAKGVDGKSIIRREIRHSLGGLLEKAKELGLAITDEAAATLVELHADFGSHRFRYPKLGRMTIRPFRYIDETVEELRKAVYPAINAKMQEIGVEIPPPAHLTD